jgi:excisionase family DNA binding protein
MDDNLRPLTCSVSEAAKILGISRAPAYRAVARGEIPAIRIGGRVLVPRAALEQMLALPSAKSKED